MDCRYTRPRIEYDKATLGGRLSANARQTSYLYGQRGTEDIEISEYGITVKFRYQSRKTQVVRAANPYQIRRPSPLWSTYYIVAANHLQHETFYLSHSIGCFTSSFEPGKRTMGYHMSSSCCIAEHHIAFISKYTIILQNSQQLNQISQSKPIKDHRANEVLW